MVSKNTQMMVDEIIKEAKQKSEKIISSAKKEADMIINAAKFTAREEKEKALKEARGEGKRVHEEIIARGRMQSKKEVLQIREKSINQIYQDVEAELQRYVESESYKKNIVKMAIAACKKLGVSDVVILANKRDISILKKSEQEIIKFLSANKDEKIQISFGAPIQCTGGVIVKRADGKVEVDETFDGRMKREMEPLRIKIAKILFEGS